MTIMPKPNSDHYSAKEAASRRDEVIRRMANTPPQPKVSPRPEKKTKTVSDRAVGKTRARREG